MSNQAPRGTVASTPSNSAADSTADQNANRYFDLHATGVGYLNRVRTVKVKGKGNDYLACDIAALRGEKGDVAKTYFNCKVTSTEAQRVIREVLAEHVNADRKILVRFKAGDLIPDSFPRKNPKEGEDLRLHNIHAHLLFLYWAKVDKEYVYQAPTREDAAAQNTPAQANATPAPAVAQQPRQAPTKGRVFAAARDGDNHGMSEEDVDAQILEMEGAN
jgi:hypothetical protein